MTIHRHNNLAIFMLCMLTLAGCIIRPRTIHDSHASFDGGVANSGNLGFYTNNAGVPFMVITPHKMARYEAMILAGYGTNFLPHLKVAEGVTPFTNGTWLLDLEHQEKFSVMNQRRKEQTK